MEHPSKIFKHPSEALFVIVLRTPTKELSELPIFNSACYVSTALFFIKSPLHPLHYWTWSVLQSLMHFAIVSKSIMLA